MNKKIFRTLFVFLLSLSLVSCTQTEIGNAVIKQDIVAHLNTFASVADISNLNVKAQRASGDFIDVDTAFDFSDATGNHSAEMTLTYGKTSGKWEIKNHLFIRANIKTDELVYDYAKMETYIKDNPSIYYAMDYESHFIPENLHFKTATKVSENTARVVYDYSATALNWTFNETYTLIAKYTWPNDWTFTTEDWSFNYSTDWAGTWKIEFHKPDGTLAETINNIVITGEASYSENKTGTYEEKNTLLVDFTRKGKHYRIPATYRNGGTDIVLELGGDEWIIMGFWGVVDANTGALTGYTYYTANGSYESGGVLTRIN